MSATERGSLAAGSFAHYHRHPRHVGGGFPSLLICSLDFFSHWLRGTEGKPEGRLGEAALKICLHPPWPRRVPQL